MSPARFLLVPVLSLATAAPVAGQRDDVLASRWVGMHQGRPLQFEFYGDTMLVVNDRWALDFRLTRDSLVALGDTSLMGRYRIVRDRLLFETRSGVVTMAPQSYLARPLDGRWIGSLGTPDGATLELIINPGGRARWRNLAGGGSWIEGEWDRASRIITFVWPDETEWKGQYDPVGNALLLENTVEGAGSTILRRAFR